MTVIGAGGVVILEIERSRRFQRDYKKLTVGQQALADERIGDLLTTPMPKRLKFEKLKGFKDPDIYSGHLDGNYKLTFEITGNLAFLRRVATHDEIDRQP